MACLAMHLAIAKKYVQNNPSLDFEVYQKGAYLPDVSSDKFNAHYGIKIPVKTVKDMLDSKIDIKRCAQDLDLTIELNRAVFLHLVTDYLFYNFVYSEELETKTPEQITQMMYQDYDYVTDYVVKKFDITIPQEISHLVQSKSGNIKSMFFDPESTDKFVKLASQFNLDLVKAQIISSPTEFLNNFLSQINK